MPTHGDALGIHIHEIAFVWNYNGGLLVNTFASSSVGCSRYSSWSLVPRYEHEANLSRMELRKISMVF